MKDIFTIQRAANAARVLQASELLGVGVRAGQYQVQHITYTNGVSTVVPVTDWMHLSSVLSFLESMQ
jgi:hypothetical protein